MSCTEKFNPLLSEWSLQVVSTCLSTKDLMSCSGVCCDCNKIFSAQKLWEKRASNVMWWCVGRLPEGRKSWKDCFEVIENGNFTLFVRTLTGEEDRSEVSL
eukprot:TRINITY_DN6420_c0_g1_i1.p1 TRINITY_DN6420_c0_g1~~TRINITY_DN6420_c0_g1_i1.p1  ORF type:complete len:101 (-),score=7.19 TRINITY_DN6420_c0_g1_i1:77-379(-)